MCCRETTINWGNTKGRGEVEGKQGRQKTLSQANAGLPEPPASRKSKFNGFFDESFACFGIGWGETLLLCGLPTLGL